MKVCTVKNLNIESYYNKIEKLVLLAEAYTEIKGLSFIIKMCRLKPFEKVIDLSLHRHWIDEFGNSLKIKSKRLFLTYNNLAIKHSDLPCTDLYYGLSIDKIVKISKLAYLCHYKDEEDYYVISLLGIDNYLRTYSYYQGEWKQIPSLTLGMKTLKFIANNQDIKYFLNSAKKENLPFPCQKGEEWLTLLPTSKVLAEILKTKHDAMFSFIHGE